MDRTGLDDEDGSVDEGDEHDDDHHEDEDEDEDVEEEHPGKTGGKKGDAGSKHKADGGHAAKSDAGKRGHDAGGEPDENGDEHGSGEHGSEGPLGGAIVPGDLGASNDVDAGVPPARDAGHAHPAPGVGANAGGSTNPGATTNGDRSPGASTNTGTVPNGGSTTNPGGSKSDATPGGTDSTGRDPSTTPGGQTANPLPPTGSTQEPPEDHTGHEMDAGAAADPGAKPSDNATPNTPVTPDTPKTPEEPKTPDAPPAADPCEGLKGPEAGLAFTAIYCSECHSTEVHTLNVITDQPNLLDLGARLRARVVEQPGGMPPAYAKHAPPTANEVAKFDQWLKCNGK